jgi:uncharacterized protein
MDAKEEQLERALQDTDGVLVAFSRGVDSTFLLKIAHMVLGERAIALTASSPTAPPAELGATQKFTAELGIRHIICRPHELDLRSFTQNPPNLCFLQRRALRDLSKPGQPIRTRGNC